MKESKFRTQWSDPLPPKETVFPPSVVQPGMSPSISQMVRTRSVGGNIEEYEMDGIAEDAPFDSEYYDFFDMEDMAGEISQDAAAERQAAEKSPSNKGKPLKSDIHQDSASVDDKESE